MTATCVDRQADQQDLWKECTFFKVRSCYSYTTWGDVQMQAPLELLGCGLQIKGHPPHPGHCPLRDPTLITCLVQSLFLKAVCRFLSQNIGSYFLLSTKALISFEWQRSILRWTHWTKPSSVCACACVCVFLFPNMAVGAYARYLHKSFVYC